MELCSLPYEEAKRKYGKVGKECARSITYRREVEFLKVLIPSWPASSVLFHRKRADKGFTFFAQFPELDEVLGNFSLYRSVMVGDYGNLVLPYSLEIRLTAKTRNYEKAIEILKSFRMRLHEATSRAIEIEPTSLS